MARRPTPEMTALTVHIPRGHAGYWQIIRELDRIGPWSVATAAGQTNARREAITDYVSRLCKAGIAERVGAYQGPVTSLPLYRLLRRPIDYPRLRRDGSESLPTGQEQMWRAIRALGTFSYLELAHAASTDDVQVAPAAAKTYVNRLGRAGYLVPVQPGKPRTATIWRLKPSMNTGPLPPLIMRTKLIWDQNTQEVMATDPAREVRS